MTLRKSLKDCDMKELVSLSDEEMKQIKERYKFLVSKICVSIFQHLGSFKI